MTKTTPRKFVSIIRTISKLGFPDSDDECHYIDAVADDGTAWVLEEFTDGWKQLPPLPHREQ